MIKNKERVTCAVFPLVLLTLAGLWSCVSMAPNIESRQWACDARADQTVKDENWEQALMRHQEFLAANPGNCLALYHLGYIWGQTGDREKEIEHYNWAVACGYNNDDQLYFNLGMAYADLDQMDNAIASIERATTLMPKNAENHFGLGLIAVSAGRPDLARRALTTAVDLDPGHWDARIELARLDLDLGRLEEARIQLEAVQKGAPDHEALQTLWRIFHDREITAFDHE